MKQEVVVFDLDHTLIKTDLLQEQILIALKKNPLNILPMFRALLKGLLNNKCSFLDDKSFDQSKKGGGTLAGTKVTTSDEALIKRSKSRMKSYFFDRPLGSE
jgi:hypothetical protein